MRNETARERQDTSPARPRARDPCLDDNQAVPYSHARVVADKRDVLWNSS